MNENLTKLVCVTLDEIMTRMKIVTIIHHGNGTPFFNTFAVLHQCSWSHLTVDDKIHTCAVLQLNCIMHILLLYCYGV